MAWLDFLLNIIGLLLWMNWRSLSAPHPPSPLSLAATVRPADRQGARHWLMLAFLGGLLILRALFYYQLGGALNWTPKLYLGLVIISFKCETVGRYLLFSGLSFLQIFAVFYFWLLLLSALQGRPLAPDPPTRFIRLLLGRPARWPEWGQILLPFVLATAAWPGLQWLMQGMGLLPEVTGRELLLDSARFSLVVILAWKYLLLALFFLHFVNLYVYLGRSSFWPFIARTGRLLLRPLRWLRIGKLDLSAPAGMALVFALCWPLERWPEWWKPPPAPPAKTSPAAGRPAQ